MEDLKDLQMTSNDLVCKLSTAARTAICSPDSGLLPEQEYV